MNDNLELAFVRACRVVATDPRQEELARAIILLADHSRQLELRISMLEGRQQDAALDEADHLDRAARDGFAHG